MAKILMVLTGAGSWTLKDGTKHPTGFWAEEAVVPYQALKAAGHEVAVATPGGVVPTADAGSLSAQFTGGEDGARRMTGAVAAMAELRSPAALLAARRADGTSSFAGYRVAAFTNEEEVQGGLAEKAKWLLEDRLVADGVEVDKAAPWTPHVVVDRNLITGQNPMSSAPLADELVKVLG